MRTFNTYYTTLNDFVQFLALKHITDNDKILIQIFTTNVDEAFIGQLLDEISSLLPRASIIGATTDGEICNGKVSTGQTVISLSQFEATTLKTVLVEGCMQSEKTGKALAEALTTEDTRLIITFAEGLHCDGEAYLDGISAINENVVVAGGLAGDNAKFEKTCVFTQDGITCSGVVGVSLRNADMHIYTDYDFNWLEMGKEMIITKVDKNRVYTIDGMNVYEIYKKYLGEEVADKLPSIGLQYPLILKREGLILARSMLYRNDDGSFSFAGEFKKGDVVRFGYGNAEMILNHSMESHDSLNEAPIESLFVYSCMARRRFMPDMIENEIRPLSDSTNVSGFFTYGEFFSTKKKNELFNQTMTIVGISESSSSLREKHRQIAQKPFVLNTYQTSIKALSHLLNVTTEELDRENQELSRLMQGVHAREESFRHAQEIGHFGSWEVDFNSKKVLWSNEMYAIYKADPKTYKPTIDTFLERVTREDKPKILEAMNALKDGEVKTDEVHIRRVDEKIIIVRLNVKMIFDENGNPSKMMGTTLDITEQVKLREKNRELASIIENSTTEVYILEKSTYKYLYANQQGLNALGYTLDEMKQMSVFDINPDLTPKEAQMIAEHITEKDTFIRKSMHVRKDGTSYPVQSRVEFTTYNNREVGILLDMDITELKDAEQKQKEQAQILEQIHDSVVSTDLHGVVTHWNHGAEMMHGYTKEEMIGKNIDILYPKEDLELSKWMVAEVLSNESHNDEIRKVNKKGKLIYTDVSLSLLKNEEGEVIGVTRYSQDITHKKEIERALKKQTELLNFQAYYDDLTKLPNRALFNDRLEQAIINAKRTNEEFALLFMDLDNFKQINDTLGHQYGDEVLKIIAKRVKACTRKQDTISRLGGDEFTILIHGLKTSNSVKNVAQKIIDTVKSSIMIDEHELYISASIGISLYPGDSIFKSDLLKYADSAMYKAKEEGKDNYRFYASDMTTLAFEKVLMETNLRNAVKLKELEVYYQPQIDMRDDSIIGLEALVRWVHPGMGMVFPDKFIPLAEETGIIAEIDSYVMKQAMIDMAQWHKEGLNPGILALNVSMTQLANNQLVTSLKENVATTGFDLNHLEMEITESSMMKDPMQSIEQLNTLNNMGIEIAIDDFGTGYSSLAYLKRLPVDKLKIDRSFIHDVPHEEEDCTITKAVIALARSLRLKVIAEGVETEEQKAFLLANGCFKAQGFYYSKALSKEEITQYLKQCECTKHDE